MEIQELERNLDSFDEVTRLKTLQVLREKVNSGEIICRRNTGFINLHCHTFFSFNAYGYSPAHIAWRALKERLEVVGIVDFDVLDGVDEILKAGEILGIKTVAGLETRVFIKEYSDKVTNSPHEPGISYFIGTGFYKTPLRGSTSEKVLLKLQNIVRMRNLTILKEVNNFLQDVEIDYENDVLPLTPKGNATERHILVAIDRKVRQKFNDDSDEIISFWSKKLQVDSKTISSVIDLPHELNELLRIKLMKYGAPGYVLPDKGSFPSLEEVIEMIENTDALPTAGWLDGTSEGEKNIEELLEFMIKKGVVALTIIPDRNWNIKDKKEKEIKVRNLHQTIKVAQELNLPIIVGTEMNKYGQKFVDDFTVPELSPYLEYFRESAFFAYGHTQMGKMFNKGYNSPWAKQFLPDTKERKRFYTEIGKIINPNLDYANIKNFLEEDVSPDKIYALVNSRCEM